MDVLQTLDRSLRDVGNAALDVYGRWRSRRYDLRQTVVIACTGRGGSTWLAQIVASMPGYHILWEQLHWKSNPECVEYGFGRPIYLRPDADHPEKRQYVYEVLSGQKLPRGINSARYFHPWTLLALRGYVVKLVTGSLLLPWMTAQFPVRAIYQVRHPCAVVSSQLIHGAWEDVGKSFCRHDTLFEEQPHLGALYERVSTHEEVLAFNWAVQNFVPLNAPAPHRWVTTTYEHVVDRGEAELRRLFDALGEPLPDAAPRMLRRPSATTVDESNVAQGRDPLRGWTQKLTPAQVDTILGVVHDAGIHLYTDALLPNPDALPPSAAPAADAPEQRRT